MPLVSVLLIRELCIGKEEDVERKEKKRRKRKRSSETQGENRVGEA